VAETQPAAARRRLGGRSARVRAAVLQAAYDLLLESGRESVTIPAVAARSGVHETSIYRRWGTRHALLLETTLHFGGEAVATPDTGALRSDLTALLDRIVAFLVSPPGRAFMTLSASTDPAAVAGRQNYFRRRFDLAMVIFERARARGEFPADGDAGGLLEALVAPLYLRLLVTGEPLETWPRDETIDRLLSSYGASR
jgi:AcrR family transcriptional regulator